jgi:Glycosyltransferase family 92
MSNFRLLFNRLSVKWHIVLVFIICLTGIHFFFLNDYQRGVKESPVGVAPSLTTSQPTSESNGFNGEISDTNLANSGTNAGNVATGSGEPLSNSAEEYVAVCVAMRNQTRDLPEWLTHHYHHLGIKRFYIMDDGSDPPISSYKLDYGIPESAVTFHYQPRDTRVVNQQMIFYQQCQEWWGSNHTWIAYIDGDEFLEATGDESLEDILRSFDPDETVGALGVHWKMHNSNGLLTRPESCRKGFTTCLWDSPADYSEGTDDNHHIKSIVKTSKFLHWSNPHKFDLKDGANTVTEHGDVVTTPAWRSPITRDRIALHHYAVKSRQEYEEKMMRSNAMSEPKGEWFWDHMENTPTTICTEMAQYDP